MQATFAQAPTEAVPKQHVFEKLVSSSVYQEYERAFSETTDLPLALRPLETWQLAHRGKRHENPFCGLMAQKSRACAACLQVQQSVVEHAQEEAYTLTCPQGLTETAIPVKLGERVIGFLQTGQIFRKKPTPAQFERAAAQLAEYGIEIEKEELKKLYYGTPVLSPKKYDSAVRLLCIFATQLSAVSNRVVLQQQNAEPPAITRAKEFIHDHQTEDFSLRDAARAANMSVFYFCKMFKRTTGLNFTDYVTRVRLERAKNLLLNPNLRVSEIAYEVGFQSLTHFNRVFRKIVGQSPTHYRSHAQVS